MKSMKLRRIGIAVVVAAAGSLAAVTTPAVAGTLLGGATVTNGARGAADGRVIDGPVTIIMPKTRRGRKFDVMAANINLPANGGGVDWHTHPGPTFGIVTGGGTLTIIDDDCVEHEYQTGQAFVAPKNPHTARNFSNAPVTVRATFFLPHTAPPTPPTVFVPPDGDDVLDTYCQLVE
ncbi:cupin domain-containing protein [Luteimonas soli]|uniref:Cupin domain-containing protein n=1 Tax=Luteimonas soli TaxID=1648966 RepID=A0ABV7XR23_9GAMM